MNKWKCFKCGWVGLEDEVDRHLVYPETRHDPAEWEFYCPECKSEEVEEDTIIYCDGCGDVPVKDEDERCTECLTCEAEAKADAAREGHV